MNPFLKNIIGEKGIEALDALIKMSPTLKSYISPRVVIGWLRNAKYGQIPNIPESPFSSLVKNGYGFTGTALVKSEQYTFSNVPEEHVAAIVTLAFNEVLEPVSTKDVDIAKLAKTIDLLVKAQTKVQFERTKPANNLEPMPPVKPDTQNVQTQAVKPKLPKLKKPVGFKPIKFNKSEVQNRCSVCSGRLFDNEVFVGCTCFKPLAKGVKTNCVNDQITLTFDNTWDQEAILSLTGILRNGK